MMGYKYKRKTAEEKKAEIEQLTKQLEGREGKDGPTHTSEGHRA